MTGTIFSVDKKHSTLQPDTFTKESSKSKRKLLVWGAIICLVVVVSSVVITAFVVGTKLGHPSFKKYTNAFQDPDTGLKATQEYSVSEDEIVVSYPAATLLLDRKRGFLVFKENDGGCYVNPFNVTDIPDSQVLVEYLKYKYTNAQKVAFLRYNIHPTGVFVASRDTVSETANRVCYGSVLEWGYLSKEEGVVSHGLVKREEDPHPTKTTVCTVSLCWGLIKITVKTTTPTTAATR